MWTVVVVIWFSVTLHLVDAADKCGLTELPDISDTSSFLDDKEALVQRIATFALQNYRNRSALVAICNNSTICSRGVCRPLLRELKENALTCEAIPSNPDCVGRGNKICTTALLSRDHAYIRLSPQARISSNLDCNISSSICTQQGLDDQVFKSSSNQESALTLQAYIYFGANDGVWRLYPGKELNETGCNGPDSRKRPWYVGATALQKDLVVLLDNGSSMGKALSASTGSETIFNASRSVTLELLDTLSPGDQISVFTFGSSSSLIGRVTVNSALNSVNDPGVLPLKTNVSNIPDPSYTGTQVSANLTAGLLAALDQFEESSVGPLKAIIIITAGEISGEDLSPSLVLNLTAQNVRIFINRFLGNDIDNLFSPATLQIISCTLQGWYEEGFYSKANPLGTLQSFYSYVAKLRFDQPTQAMPYWVPTYLSSSGLGEVITTAYPVFDNKTLVGVDGVDILLNSFLLTASDSQMILQGRNTLGSMLLSGPPTPIDCGQKLNPQGVSSCPAYGVNGFCTSDIDTNPDKVAALKERVCCKDCCPWKSDDGLSSGGLAGVVIGSSILGITLGVLCCCVWKFCRPPKPGGGQMRSPASESGIVDPRHASNNSPVYKYDDKM